MTHSITTTRHLQHGFIAVAIFSAIAVAHGGPGHGHGFGSAVYFDADTITTTSGTLSSQLEDWRVWGHGNHTGGGMHYEFEAEDGKHYELMLAPVWYLEENGILLQAGNKITVRGSIVEAYDGSPGGHGHHGGHMDDEEYFITTEITADGVTLKLRDEEGYPLWRGGFGWHGGPWFDPDTVTTLRGFLGEELGLWSCWGFGNYTGNGMHQLFTSNEGETFYAMLAPWWYLDENGIELRKDSRIKLTGSVVEPYWSGYDDYRYLIASKITVGGTTIELRDEFGYPLWHGTGWHYYSPAYEDGKVRTLIGTVVKVRSMTHGKDLDPGLEIILRVGGKKNIVFIAPKWYSDFINLDLTKGSTVKVRGAVTSSGKRNIVVARYIVTDGKRRLLRNAKGVPLWIKGAK